MVGYQNSFLFEIDFQCHKLLSMYQMLPRHSKFLQLRQNLCWEHYTMIPSTINITRWGSLTVTISSVDWASSTRLAACETSCSRSWSWITRSRACTPLTPRWPSSLDWQNGEANMIFKYITSWFWRYDPRWYILLLILSSSYQHRIVYLYHYLNMVYCRCILLFGIEFQCHTLLNMSQRHPRQSKILQLIIIFIFLIIVGTNACFIWPTLTVSSFTCSSSTRQISIEEHGPCSGVGITGSRTCTPIVPCCPHSLNWNQNVPDVVHGAYHYSN